ncbi:MAG: tRNA (adenosine(37)-N6)-threonylcarbamoyltransferase complex dimerization subunit type 1 TsaB [Wigglesworthia glossinidia]|nr:tRNA (adenosine(37)-N6)-threonylcarbamoyltransferase complex dimerization subunit type 1 TsaB [Wigglesworthia glossinidia]
MNLLAIDCVSKICSVTCMKDTKILSELFIQKKHTKYIFYIIDNILHNLCLSFSNIDYLIFNKGPGSLLGLRISISIMQGLSLTKKLPILGISYLHILSKRIFRYTDCIKILIAVNFKKNLIHWAVYYKYNNITKMLKEHICTPKKMLLLIRDISNIQIIAGDSWDKYQELIIFKKKNTDLVYIKHIFIYPKDIVILAKNYFLNKKISNKNNFYDFNNVYIE